MSGEPKLEAGKAGEMTDLKFFEFTRAQIQHEDSLINNRLTWLLAMQAFLFAAYGYSLAAESAIRLKGYTDPLPDYLQKQIDLVNHARLCLAIMSFLSSIVLLCGIAAAAASMESLTEGWKKRDGFKNGHFPQVIGEGLPYLRIYGGLLPTYGLPIATSIIWILLEYKDGWAWIFFGIVILCALLGFICLVWRHTLCQSIFRFIRHTVIKSSLWLLRKRRPKAPETWGA